MEKTVSFDEQETQSPYRARYSIVEPGEPIGHGREGLAERAMVVVEAWVPGTDDRRATVLPAETIARVSGICSFSVIQGVVHPKKDAIRLQAWARGHINRLRCQVAPQSCESAVSVALQVLEAIRAVAPDLIADHMPPGWGMSRLRREIAKAPEDTSAEALFAMDDTDQVATMAQAQAEHIRNSGGLGLYDDGMGDEDREAATQASQQLRALRATSVMDDGSNDIEF